MKNLLMALVVTFTLTNQYAVGQELYCDFVLQGESYEGVTYDDMNDMLNDACAEDYDATH
jgi:hypothetical protein